MVKGFSILVSRNSEVFDIEFITGGIGNVNLFVDVLKGHYEGVRVIPGKVKLSDYMVLENCIIKRRNEDNVLEGLLSV